MQKALSYARKHFESFVQELMECLSMPSVSALPEQAHKMEHCARWLADYLLRIGLHKAEIAATPGHPVVFGEHRVSDHRPTLMVYGHYDVQPAGPDAEWQSAPFAPQIRDGAIYARGASDNKGQFFMILSAIQAWMRGSGQLPLNLKVVLEGDEETSSESMESFVDQNLPDLQAQALLVCDTLMVNPTLPALTISLRGIAALQLELTGPSRDLHSGEYGGAAPNPLTELCRLLASLHDEQGRVAVDGFYGQVIDLSPAQRRQLGTVPFDSEAWLSEAGLKSARTDPGYSILESSTARPCLDIHGLWGGYSGPGLRTVIPPKAGAKLSARLVAQQSAADISSKLQQHVREHAPPWIDLRLESLAQADPVAIDPDRPALKAAQRAMKETFGCQPALIREGGSIPALTILHKRLGLDTVLAGFALQSDAPHAPNEHFGLDRFSAGIETIIRFFAHLNQ